MKNLFKHSALWITAAALLTGSAAAENNKVASVNIESLMAQYDRVQVELDKLKLTEDKLRAAQEERMAPVLKMKEELAALKEKFESPTLSKKVKDEAVSSYKVLLAKAKQLNEANQVVLQRQFRASQLEREAVLLSVKDDMVLLVEKYAEDNGYALVFDVYAKTQSLLPTIIYNKSTTDITDEVIKFINAKAETQKDSE